MAGTREADCLCLVPMQPTEDGILWHATKLRTKTCLHLDTVVVVMLMVCHMCLCLPHRHAIGRFMDQSGHAMQCVSVPERIVGSSRLRMHHPSGKC